VCGICGGKGRPGRSGLPGLPEGAEVAVWISHNLIYTRLTPQLISPLPDCLGFHSGRLASSPCLSSHLDANPPRFAMSHFRPTWVSVQISSSGPPIASTSTLTKPSCILSPVFQDMFTSLYLRFPMERMFKTESPLYSSQNLAMPFTSHC
jgi:hypothetical protein